MAVVYAKEMPFAFKGVIFFAHLSEVMEVDRPIQCQTQKAYLHLQIHLRNLGRLGSRLSLLYFQKIAG
jgi:hypothetical protein